MPTPYRMPIYVVCRMCVMPRLCEEQKVVSVRSLYVCLIVCLIIQVSTTRPCREQRDWHCRKFSTPNSMHIYSHTHIFHSGFFFWPFKQDNAAAATAPRRIVSNVEKGSSKDRRQPSACAAVVPFCERTISSTQSRRTVHAPDRRALSYIWKLSFCVFCSLL